MFSGLLLVDKPSGITSHDVVLMARRALGVDRIGHSGTLDPMATGLLILLVGPATKLQERFQRLPKTYTGTAVLGVETDSGDFDGKVTSEKPVPALTSAQLEARMQELTGRLELPPPAYSAVKVKGKPLYHYARKGIAVELKPRTQEVREWRLAAWQSPAFQFSMEVASGTYVRAIVTELGSRLGCGAALKSLRRESVGSFRASNAVTGEQLRSLPRGELAARLVQDAPAGV